MEMIMNKRIRAVCSVIAVFICSFANSANEEAIYSKADAALMFSMTLDDWNTNVVNAHASGVGVGIGQPENGYGLAMQTAVGQILVNPYYSSPETPEFLQVTIVYPSEIARNLTLEGLKETGQTAVEQMLPEFTMTYEVESFEGGFLKISFIRQN
jgi:hypothetical protein